jgi:hypothetical protein
MQSKRDPEDALYSERRAGPSFYERAIRTTIGRGLRSYYDLSEPIPDRMLELLKQLDDDTPSEEEASTEPKSDNMPDGGGAN